MKDGGFLIRASRQLSAGYRTHSLFFDISSRVFAVIAFSSSIISRK